MCRDHRNGSQTRGERTWSEALVRMPYFSFLRPDPKLYILKVHLCDLHKRASSLHLNGSGSLLRLLACINLDLQHLELCKFTIHQAVFYEFMRNKTCSLSSIGFHEVHLIFPNKMKFGSVELSPGFSDSFLHSSTRCITTSSCLVYLKEGWRLSQN